MLSINTTDYKKITNFFRGLYRAKDGAIFKYVNIYSVDDLVQDYLLFKVEGKNYKTPKQFYFYKLRDAYNHKHAAPQVYMSHVSNHDCSSYNEEIMDFSDDRIENHLKFSKSSETENEISRDLCIAFLGEFMKGLAYYVFLCGFLDYELTFATPEEIELMKDKLNNTEPQKEEDIVLTTSISA